MAKSTAIPQVDNFKNINSDSGSTTADSPNDTLSFTGTGGISTSITGDTLTIDGTSNDTFIEHGDTPATYTSQGLNVVRVNVGETALEFTDLSTSDVDEGTNLYYTEARVSANTDVSANTTHRTSDGSDHTYINQDVTSNSSPSFKNLTVDNGGLVNTNLNVNGSTDFTIRATATDTLVIRDSTAGSNRISISGTGDITFNSAYTFPTSDGTTDQILVTDGVGNVDWQDLSSLPASNIRTITTKTANYTATTSDDIIECDASSGGFTITLPTAVGNSGLSFTIVVTEDSAGNKVTVDPNGSQTINGDSTKELKKEDSMVVVSNGSNWRII